MQDSGKVVLLVLNPNFGTRLKDVDKMTPIWVVRSPENEENWDPREHAPGSAIFNASGPNLNETLLSVLPDVDLHFGAYSSSEPYARIQVEGLTLTEKLARSLAALGFSIESRGSGVATARRSPPAVRKRDR